MAFTLNVANYGTASGISLAASGTPDLVVACFTKDVATLPTDVQYGGVAMTALTHTANGAQGTVIYYLVSGIPAGTQSITYTLTGAHRCWGGAFDVAAGKIAAFDIEAGSSGTSATPSQAITPGAQPNVIIAAIAHEGASIMTAKGTGQVGMETGSGDGFFDEGTWNSAATYEATTSTAANAQTFTNGASDTWSFRVAVFKEVSQNYTLTAENGAYAESGQAATLARQITLTAAVGAYALSGQAAGLLRKYPMPAGNGSYALTGQNATLIYTQNGYTLAAASGACTLTGQGAGLLYGREVVADPSAFLASGQAATLAWNRRIAPAGGTYAFSGANANLYTGSPPAAGGDCVFDVHIRAIIGADISFRTGLAH